MNLNVRNFLLTIVFLLLGLITAPVFAAQSTSLSSTNEMIVSPIGDQQVVAGGAINIFFTAFDPNISGATFSSTDLPSFCQIINNGDNSGKITVNTAESDAGDYLFHLQVSGTAGATTVPIHLQVLAHEPNATVYYCDPATGNINNTGDANHPWSTLEAVFSNNKTFLPGDIIFLRSGFHGSPQVLGQNSGTVYIAAQANHQPKVRKMNFVFAKNWVVSGIEISPESAGMTETVQYVRMVANAQHNIIENCHIYAIKNSAVWTTNQMWYDNCGDGILNKGEYNTIRNNLITNTYFSVTIDGEHNHFDYNIIDRFGGDAIRGIKSYNTFNHNVVMNGVVSDYETGNHDDAFQSWVFGGSIKSIQLIGNIVFSCTDPNLPLKTEILQGIVIFDGYAEDWVIANNLVVMDHPHGISLYGAKNCKVVNNTVIRNPLELFYYGSHPWIKIAKHKNGGLSTGNLIRNNYSSALALESIPGTDDHNSTSTNYNSYLNDYDHWDFHLHTASSAVNSGLKDDAPTVDYEGYVRLPSANIDRGCFEKEADVFDITKPTAPADFHATEIKPAGLMLSWTASTDNTGISNYIISYDGKNIRTVGTEMYIGSLTANHDYTFEIAATDFSGNISEKTTLEVTTPQVPNEDSTYIIKVFAHTDDQQLRGYSTYNRREWVGLYEHKIGGVGSNYDASAVIPFKLPVLGEGEEILFAKLKLNLKAIQNTPASSVAIYGLNARNISEVDADSHWQGDYGSDAGATALMQNYLSMFSPIGTVPMPENATVAIANYINTQYEGAGAGNYIFLRLNSNTVNEATNNYFILSSANEPDVTKRPVLELTVKKQIVGFSERQIHLSGLKVHPNPLSAGDLLIVELPDLSATANSTIQIHDLLGRLLLEKNVDAQTKTLRIATENIDFVPGTYILSWQGTSFLTQTKFIIR